MVKRAYSQLSIKSVDDHARGIEGIASTPASGERQASAPVHVEPIRWNQRLSKSFDVTREQFPPRSAEEALVAKYLGVEIKYLDRREIRVPSVRLGAFLSAVDDVLGKWSVDDVRNLNVRGEETPPSYEVIQLNSTQSSDFLVDGMRFVKQTAVDGSRATLRVQPAWYGLDVTVYGMRSLGTAATLLAEITQRSKEINFLKGEAFSLSGEFLPTTGEAFADLFLDPKNAVAIARVVTLVNTKGKDLENRGVILMGPPGTGKTLAARIVRNEAKATFIWVSSRDFHYSGSFGGFSQAFDIARECAPSVVVFEDIDNWLYDTTVDLIKTEMDGVAKSTGVVTMMTTNFPELLPAALIDRPGRFHDVLKFDLPDDAARKEMLVRWLPGLSASVLPTAVKATAGYSGAHVRELARFTTIIAEQEGVTIEKALTSAITKLSEQRDLINATQRRGSRYRMAPELVRKSADVQKGYSLLEIKSLDAERRTFTGVATSPVPDRVGDIVEPLGISYKNPLPLLLSHDSKKPVGLVEFDPPTAAGVTFRGSIPTVEEPGIVKDRTDEAWHSLKYRLMAGFSIGFRGAEGKVKALKDGGLHFLQTQVFELSLVTIPMHQDAVLTTIKSLDFGLAANGTGAVVESVRKKSAGASAPMRVVKLLTAAQERVMKPITDQIKSFEATRQSKQAAQDAIIDKSAEEGVTLDAEQKEHYDTLTDEIKELDEHIGRLRAREKANEAAAKAVAGSTQAEGTAGREGRVAVAVKDTMPADIAFGAMVLCKAHSYLEFQKGNFVTPQAVALARYPSSSLLQGYFQQKTAVAGGTTTDTNFASALLPPAQVLDSAFLEYLRPKTLVDRFGTNQNGVSIPSLKRVPFNVKVQSQTSGASANWVGEGKAKPVTKFNTTTATLLFTKIAAICVITEELARFSRPGAEGLVRDELARAVIAKMDADFIDPAVAVSAGVNPASITNGLTGLTTAGVSAANVLTDVQALIAPFILAGYDISQLVLLMPNTLALTVSLMQNSLGQSSFPGMTVTGGTLAGIPVLASQYLASGASYGNMVVALSAENIALADDGNVSIDVSREASIQMDDSPTQDATAGTGSTSVSLWQTNSVGIRAEREIHWKKLRSNAVVYMDDVNWGSIGSPY